MAARAAGNPFFAEEMVRDLAERGVLHGGSGAYLLGGDVEDESVPATLQATIGACIDRLDPTAKRTLNAAAAIGSRFDADLLDLLVDAANKTPLIDAQLVEQVRFAPRAEYAFRHPMIRAVAYGIRSSDPIARSCTAAWPSRSKAVVGLRKTRRSSPSTLRRPGTCVRPSPGTCAPVPGRPSAISPRRSRVGGGLGRSPTDCPKTIPIECRCASNLVACCAPTRFGAGAAVRTRVSTSGPSSCTAAGDRRPLAIGMIGWLIANNLNANNREASRLAGELVQLLESIGDPMLTVALLPYVTVVKHETGEMAEILRVAQHVIDMAEGDPTKGNLVNDSPLSLATVMRGLARACLGISRWQEDIRQAIAMGGSFGELTSVGIVWFAYLLTIPNGLLLPDTTAQLDTAGALTAAEQSGDDLALDLARTTRGVVLVVPGRPGARSGP